MAAFRFQAFFSPAVPRRGITRAVGQATNQGTYRRAVINSGKSIATFIILFFVVWSIRATVLFPIDKNISSPALRQVYADTLRVIIWVLPVFIYLTFIDKTYPMGYLRLNTLGNKQSVLPSSVIAFLYLVVILFVDFAQAGFSSKVILSPVLLSNSWVKTVLVITIAPIAEEILFRGFLLQKLQIFSGNWSANIISSSLFVAIHFPNWIYTGKSSLEIISLSVSIFALSILLGYLMQKTETLLPSIFVHMLNNIISFYVSFG